MVVGWLLKYFEIVPAPLLLPADRVQLVEQLPEVVEYMPPVLRIRYNHPGHLSALGVDSKKDRVAPGAGELRLVSASLVLVHVNSPLVVVVAGSGLSQFLANCHGSVPADLRLTVTR